MSALDADGLILRLTDAGYMGEPTRVTAGDLWSWTASFDGYSSADYALRYYLGNSNPRKTIDATPSSTGWSVSVVSAGWLPGDYHWHACLTRDGERLTVASGLLTVLPDPAEAGDRSTFAEQMVVALKSALLSSSDRATVEYELNGVRNKIDRTECQCMLGVWQERVRRKRGGAYFRTLKVPR